MGAPVEAKPFFRVPDQLHLRADLAGRFHGVPGSVKNSYLAIHTQGSNDVGVLGLVPRLVDLTFVVDLLDNLEIYLGVVFGDIATDLAPVVVEVGGVRLDVPGNLNFGNLEVVWGHVRRVSAEEEAMGPAVLFRVVLNVREPLGGQGRPVKSSAQYHVVKEWTVLLPCLVFFNSAVSPAQHMASSQT